MSPVTVKFTQYHTPFLHFIVQLCAIIGGVFTIAGITDALVHKSVRKLVKKSEEGKLM
jgi:Endoplasmic reticulum vesicle transporter